MNVIQIIRAIIIFITICNGTNSDTLQNISKEEYKTFLIQAHESLDRIFIPLEYEITTDTIGYYIDEINESKVEIKRCIGSNTTLDDAIRVTENKFDTNALKTMLAYKGFYALENGDIGYLSASGENKAEFDLKKSDITDIRIEKDKAILQVEWYMEECEKPYICDYIVVITNQNKLQIADINSDMLTYCKNYSTVTN